MLRSTPIALVMLIVALAVTASVRDEIRPATCRTHKAGAGELTECE